MDETPTSWTFLHKKLQDTMKQELIMLREVLSIMKEEENALSQGAILSKKDFSLKKSSLNKQLKELQKERNFLTKALVKTVNQDIDIHHFNSKNFNTLISQDEDNAVETFSLRDQILDLMKLVKRQKERMTQMIKTIDNPAPLPIPVTTTQRKKARVLDVEDASLE